MSAQTAIDEKTRRNIEEIGQADIIVGIPSFNNAKTINHVVRVAVEGLAKHFPGSKAVLLNSDGGSSDGTPDVFLKEPAGGSVSKVATRYQGIAGKGTALKAIYEACGMLGVRCCVVVDSDLRSITSEWIRLLAEPIMEGSAGYVTPLYLRHKYDGTITNSLAYPVTRALYGKRVRQPIGGDFGISGTLAESYLSKDVWDGPAARFGIDIFMTTTAINEGFQIRQANLGAKIHDAKDPAADLGPMLRQVVGTMFTLAEKYRDKWSGIEGSSPVPTVGPAFVQEPDPVQVTLSALVSKFKAGVDSNRSLWEQFLSKDVISELETLARLDESTFEFPPLLWVRTVYEFAVAYNSGSHPPDDVIDSLTPLYFGRTAGFVRETEEMTGAEAEEVLESLAELFEKEKPYLVYLWNRS